METRKKSKRMMALKSVALFSVMAITPVALLFAGHAPKREIATEKTRMERSQKEWRAMKTELHTILKKADKISEITTLK